LEHDLVASSRFAGMWVDADIVAGFDTKVAAGALEVVALPELDPSESMSAAIERYIAASYRVLGGLSGWVNRSSIELRYFWNNRRVNLFLICRVYARNHQQASAEVESLLQAVQSAMPAGVEVRPVERLPAPFQGVWGEIVRREAVRYPVVEQEILDYYYLLYPLAGDGRGWPLLSKYLAGLESPGSLSIMFQPTELSPTEGQAVDRILACTKFLSASRSEQNYFGFQENIAGDPVASDTYECWEAFSNRKGCLVRIGVFSHPDSVLAISSYIGSLISSRAPDNDAHGSLHTGFNVVGSSDWELDAEIPGQVMLASHSFPATEFQNTLRPPSLRRLLYYYPLQDAAKLFVLPVPDAQGAPGFAKARKSEQLRVSIHDQKVSSGLVLGRVVSEGVDGDDFDIPLRLITRHILAVGSTGSGKTTSVLSLIARLWKKHGVPFTVIEASKTEYRSLMNAPGLEGCLIFSLGNEDVSPFRLNLLEPPPGVSCSQYQGSVLSVLKLALPLFPPLPQLIEKALAVTYQGLGWLPSTTLEEGLTVPTLRDLLDSFDEVFSDLGYRGEAQNLGVALRLRLSNLLLGPIGRILDCKESVDFGALLRRPVVFELNRFDDSEQKSLLSALLLQRVRLHAGMRSCNSAEIAHVTVIEEAHRILGKSGSGGRNDDTRDQTIATFCDAISELRAFGEGFILASQLPTELASAAVGNMGTKILHRLESRDGRELVLNDFSSSDGLDAVASRLRTGEALVRTPGLDDAVLVRVVPTDGIDSSASVSDLQVRHGMASYREEIRRLLPFALCSLAVCSTGCEMRVREEGEMQALNLGKTISRIWSGEPGASEYGTGPDAAAMFLKSQNRGSSQGLYCTAVHLSADGCAFLLDKRLDVGEWLRKRLLDQDSQEGGSGAGK